MHTLAPPAASGVAEPQAHRAASADGASPPPCGESWRGAACALFTLALTFSGGPGGVWAPALHFYERRTASCGPPGERLHNDSSVKTRWESHNSWWQVDNPQTRVGRRGASLISGKSA